MEFAEPQVDEKLHTFTIESRLGKRTSVMKQLFVVLFLSLGKAITRDGISLAELISALPASIKSSFQEVQSVRDFLRELYQRINWIQFDLLYSLTQRLSLPQCNKQIQEYESKLIVYLRNRLLLLHHDKVPVYFQKCNNLRVFDNNVSSYVVDVDYVWDKELLHESSNVPQIIAKRLGLDKSLVFLRPIQDSCVYLDFMRYPELVSVEVRNILYHLTVKTNKLDDGHVQCCSCQCEERSQLEHSDYEAHFLVSDKSAPTLRQLQLTNTMTDDGESNITLQHFMNYLNTIVDEEFSPVQDGLQELMETLELNNGHLFSPQPSFDKLCVVNTIDDSIDGDYQNSLRALLELNPIAV